MTQQANGAAALIEQFSKPVRTNPVLFRINGIGFGFSGTALRHPELGEDLFVRMHWFTFVFVPIIPLGIYLLSHPHDQKGRIRHGSYYIHRAVRVRGVTEIWGSGKFFVMLVSGWLITVAVVLVIGGGIALIAALQPS